MNYLKKINYIFHRLFEYIFIIVILNYHLKLFDIYQNRITRTVESL